jgi:hypothetical protein
MYSWEDPPTAAEYERQRATFVDALRELGSDFPVVTTTLANHLLTRKWHKYLIYPRTILAHAYEYFTGSGAHLRSLNALVEKFGMFDELSHARLACAINSSEKCVDTAFDLDWMLDSLSRTLRIHTYKLRTKLLSMVEAGEMYEHRGILFQLPDNHDAETTIANILHSRTSTNRPLPFATKTILNAPADSQSHLRRLQ